MNHGLFNDDVMPSLFVYCWMVQEGDNLQWTCKD